MKTGPPPNPPPPKPPPNPPGVCPGIVLPTFPNAPCVSRPPGPAAPPNLLSPPEPPGGAGVPLFAEAVPGAWEGGVFELCCAALEGADIADSSAACVFEDGVFAALSAAGGALIDASVPTSN